MKFLRIKDNKASFLNPYKPETNEWTEIDKISKDDLMELLNKAILPEFEMDEYSEEHIGNKAHQIIYKNLYTKFLELLENKSRFKDESEKIYSDAIKKYRSELINT